MEQKILGLNTEFQSLNFKGFEEDRFSSSISLLDYDAVVISTHYIVNDYDYDHWSSGIYQNKRYLSENASIQIKEDFNRIEEQLIELLKQGKNIFILLGKNENCFIHTGKKEYSGTGKNTRTTNYVSEFDAYSFLPIGIDATHIYGNEMKTCCQHPYLEFFKQTEGLYHYEAYISSPTLTLLPLVTIHNSNKIISSVCEYGNGKIIFLPFPKYEEDYVNEVSWKKHGKIYLKALFELNEFLGAHNDDFTLPEWANTFSILDEKEKLNTLESNLLKLKKLQDNINKQKEALHNIQKYKTILTSTGEQLETIVKTILSEIGFTLSKPERGRSDIVAKYQGIDVVAEIKGVSKSAAEKHAAQLEKWVSLFIEENDRKPKPILIVNGFYDKPIHEREEAVFPDQMIQYSTVRNHALISTTQLLCLYIDVKTNPDVLEERIMELLSTVGIYQHYDNITEYLKPIE